MYHFIIIFCEKKLIDIHPTVTTHHIGKKYILLTSEETNTDLTQIAVTQLKAGETAEEHLHLTMKNSSCFKREM